MERWYVPIGLLTLAGLLWLGNRFDFVLRIILGLWGLVLGAAGVGLLFRFPVLLADEWSLSGILGVVVFSVVIIPLSSCFLYGGYRLLRCSIWFCDADDSDSQASFPLIDKIRVMKWLRFLGIDGLVPKPAPWTPVTAEPILDIVAEALQHDDGLPYRPLSSLQGYDVFQIDFALKLRTANAFLLLSLDGRDSELDDFVKQFETIPLYVASQFVRDDERNKLKSVPKGSREYFKLQMEMRPPTMDAKGFMDPKLASLETLSSFVNYCRRVGAADSLYWQKIYTQIGLPYEKRCPQGNDPVFIDEG